MGISTLFKDFISLFYPHTCAACGKTLLQNEEMLCTYCLYELPKTNYHLYPSNPLEKAFRGRCEIAHVAALFLFQKRSNVQHLIHKLKYKGRKDIGIFLGNMLGSDLATCESFGDISVVIPLPLHRKKERKRGYNQSELFANGISAALHIPVDTHTLIRTTHTKSQTRKSRFARWQNVKDVFEITNLENLKNKHVLLVDDVITTGATMEAATAALLKIEGIKVSLACIGFAND